MLSLDIDPKKHDEAVKAIFIRVIAAVTNQENQ